MALFNPLTTRNLWRGFPLALLILIITGTHVYARPPLVGVLRSGRNQVWVERGKKVHNAHKGFKVLAGDRIKTGPGSKSLIDLPEYNTLIHLSGDSELIVFGVERGNVLYCELQTGTVWVKKRPDRRDFRLFSNGIFMDTHNVDAFFRKISNGVPALIVREGAMNVVAPTGPLVVKDRALIEFLPNGPHVFGVTTDDFVEWEEPFEEF